MLFTRVRRGLLAGLCLALAPLSLSAQSKQYDFKDPKGVNNVSFVLDSELEPIMGVANGISGEIKCDPADFKKLTGKIVIAADSVQFANKDMTKSLQGADMLDVQKHKEIIFELKSVDSVKPDPTAKDRQVLEVTGSLTCHGITKDLKVTVTVSALAGRLKDRVGGKAEGDLLVVRSQFTMKRSDFKLGAASPLVADEMQIRVAIVGQCPKS